MNLQKIVEELDDINQAGYEDDGGVLVTVEGTNHDAIAHLDVQLWDSESEIPWDEENETFERAVRNHILFELEKLALSILRTVNAVKDWDEKQGIQYLTLPDGDRRPLNGLLCWVCGEPQFRTPSGDCCVNGHGGAEGVKP